MTREVTRRAVLLAGALFSVAATARHKQRRATVRVGDVRACAVEGGFTWDGTQWIGD